MTTREEIRAWLRQAEEQGATHLIVACDTFDWSDYPVFVKPGEDVRAVAAAHDGPNMTRLMEVYNMAGDIEGQLGEARSRNF